MTDPRVRIFLGGSLITVNKNVKTDIDLKILNSVQMGLVLSLTKVILRIYFSVYGYIFITAPTPQKKRKIFEFDVYMTWIFVQEGNFMLTTPL